jgi:hypothetical protein
MTSVLLSRSKPPFISSSSPGMPDGVWSGLARAGLAFAGAGCFGDEDAMERILQELL